MERDDHPVGFGSAYPETISIHTLRMERDASSAVRAGSLSDFNPHAPHGA